MPELEEIKPEDIISARVSVNFDNVIWFTIVGREYPGPVMVGHNVAIMDYIHEHYEKIPVATEDDEALKAVVQKALGK